MSSSHFEELSWHIGHDVEVVSYGRGGHIYNVAVECNECGTVLLSFDNPDDASSIEGEAQEKLIEGVER